MRKTGRKLSPKRRQAGQRGQKPVNPSSHHLDADYSKCYLTNFSSAICERKEEIFRLLRSTARTRERTCREGTKRCVLTHVHYARKTKERKACVCACAHFFLQAVVREVGLHLHNLLKEQRQQCKHYSTTFKVLH